MELTILKLVVFSNVRLPQVPAHIQDLPVLVVLAVLPPHRPIRSPFLPLPLVAPALCQHLISLFLFCRRTQLPFHWPLLFLMNPAGQLKLLPPQRFQARFPASFQVPLLCLTVRVALYFSLLLRSASISQLSPIVVNLNPTHYPPLDRVPPTDSPEVLQWIQDVQNTGIVIPDLSLTNTGSFFVLFLIDSR
jgi:hypothetical protein